MTLRELQDRFPYGRTQWSEFRKGSKLIPKHLIADLVKDLVASPQSRPMVQRQGEELLEEAEVAARTGSRAGADRPVGTAVELQLRLDDARKEQIAAAKKLDGTTFLVHQLMNEVVSLTRRCRELEQERDHARAVSRSTEVVQEELGNTESVLVQATGGLRRARQKREEAENLCLEAEQQAAEYAIALAESGHSAADGKPLQGDRDSTGAAEEVQGVPERPPLWQESQITLEVIEEQLDGHQMNMTAARQQMGLPADGQPVLPAFVTGEVVRAVSTDNADDHADQEIRTRWEGLSREEAQEALNQLQGLREDLRQQKDRTREQLARAQELYQKAQTRDRPPGYNASG